MLLKSPLCMLLKDIQKREANSVVNSLEKKNVLRETVLIRSA